MLERLIESGTRATARRHVVPSGVAAVAAHVVIIAGAVWATLAPAGAAGTEPIPVTIAWPFTEPLERERGSDGVDEIPGPPETTIDPPSVPPVGLPSIDPGRHIEPVFQVHGVPAGAGSDGADSAPVAWLSVEEPPALLAGPPPVYPELLRAAGIPGRVVLQVVVDTLGRAERAVTVVESSNRGFDAAALAYVRAARFRPGRVRGRAVRVLIRLPIDFTLQRLR